MINWKRANRAVGRFAAWTRDPVSASAFWWKWHVRLGREAAAGLGQDLYREVRYEALVTDPDGESQSCAPSSACPTPIPCSSSRGPDKDETRPGRGAGVAADHPWAEELEI